MRTVRYILRNINTINIILAVMLVLLISTMGSSVEDIRITPPEVVKKPADQETVEVSVPKENQNPFPTDYSVIAEQNLFHPDRKIPVEAVAEAPLPTPDFVLYGTLLTEDMKVAYMEDKKSPQNTPGRPNRQSVLHQGESLSGFVVKEIDKDKVTMVRGDETVVVNLEDPEGKERNRLAQQPGQQPQGRAGRAQVSTPGVQPPPNTRRSRTRQPSRSFIPAQQRTRNQPASSDAGPSSGDGGAKSNFLNLFRR
jgi:hypothetical protein